MSQIFMFKIPKDLTSDTFHSLLPFLSDFHQEKIHAQDKWNSIEAIFYADVLLRTVLCQYFKTSNNDLILRKNIFGVPFVYNKDRFYVDLALNAHWVVCCLSPMGPISSYVQDLDPYLGPKLFGELSQSEIQTVTQNGDPQDHKVVAQFCALKNSLRKLYAGNCGYHEQQFAPPYQTTGHFELFYDQPVDVHYCFCESDTFTLMVCTQEKRPFDGEVQIFTKAELLNSFRRCLKKKGR